MPLSAYSRSVVSALLLLVAMGRCASGQHAARYAIPVDTSLVAIPTQLPDADSADDRPTFTLDGKMMYFGSRRFSQDPWRVSDPNPRWKWDSDLWYRVKTDTGWSIPINVGLPINNSGGQLNPTISPRGDELYYVQGAPVLWKARLIDGKGQQPAPVPGMLNNIYARRSFVQNFFMDSLRKLVRIELLPDSDLQLRAPDAYELHFREHMVAHLKTTSALEFGTMIRCENAITPDGRFAVFSENFGKAGQYGFGGEGGDDLWIVPINEHGQWDSVLNLNGKINSEFDETYPFIAADGVTLYFTSNRPCPTCPAGSWGGQDLYKTAFDGTHWTEPVPLGPPFNSAADDYGFSIGPDGQTAYFVSNRSGKSRFYEVKLSAKDSLLAPKQVVILQGRVTDLKTHAAIAAEIFVDDLTAGVNRFSVFSDSISGNYILAAQRGHRFGIQAVAKGYLPRSERFTVPAVGAFDRTKLDLELAPEEAGARMEFKNVYFDFGKTDLLKESKLELGRVIDFLKGSPQITIEIDGYTDDVGSVQFNDRLSRARAESVMKYLGQHGIARSRMNAKGFGKSNPRVKGTDETARAQNRRVEMVIVSDTKPEKK